MVSSTKRPGDGANRWSWVGRVFTLAYGAFLGESQAIPVIWMADQVFFAPGPCLNKTLSSGFFCVNGFVCSDRVKSIVETGEDAKLVAI